MPTYALNPSPKARSTAAACARVSSRIGERPPILAYRWRISCTSCGLVGRPPCTSCKYGSTSSRLAGPPYAIIRTATRSPAMDQLHYGVLPETDVAAVRAVVELVHGGPPPRPSRGERRGRDKMWPGRPPA